MKSKIPKAKKLPPPTPLKPGDAVAHYSEVTSSQDGFRTGYGRVEYGRVVVVWDDKGWQDCYVAFVGFNKKDLNPTKPPKDKPYILNYHNTSLAKL